MLKVDYECIRDILEYLQNNLGLIIEQNVRYKEINWKDIYNNPSLLQKYNTETIANNILKAIEAEFIMCSAYSFNNTTCEVEYCFIVNITLKGYEYLNNSKNPTVWSNIKKKVSDINKIAMPVLIKLMADESVKVFKSLISE